MGTFDVISLLFISIISAFVGFGFNMMQSPGMLFEWYKEFLINFAIIKDKRFPYDSDGNYYKESKFLRELSKPLGYCLVCNTTWIGMIMAAFYLKEWSVLHLILAIFTGVASAGIVVLISNYYYKLKR